VEVANEKSRINVRQARNGQSYAILAPFFFEVCGAFFRGVGQVTTWKGKKRQNVFEGDQKENGGQGGRLPFAVR